MKYAKLRIDLVTPAGVTLSTVEMDLTEAMDKLQWSPANTTATPLFKFTWAMEEPTGSALRSTGMFQDQGFGL